MKPPFQNIAVSAKLAAKTAPPATTSIKPSLVTDGCSSDIPFTNLYSPVPQKTPNTRQRAIQSKADTIQSKSLFPVVTKSSKYCISILSARSRRQPSLPPFRPELCYWQHNSDEIFLRPETAQGIFVNFKNVQRSMRKRTPFGIAQIGKSFRNEITPGNFTFRTREFEQMELEFFCKPGEDLEWHAYWKNFCKDWLLNLGMKEDSMRLRDHEEDELSHYSNATTDIEFRFPFGWGELWGVADRTDFDLKQHMEHSGEDFTYIDPITNERYVPYCIEPSLGADRVTLAFLCDAYDEEALEGDDKRTVLRFHPALAPFKAAVLPLSKKLAEEATDVWADLRKAFPVDYDESQSIGKRYRRQDEIGTPFCITYDFDSKEDGQVTVRHRDSMEQVRMPISEVKAYIESYLQF